MTGLERKAFENKHVTFDDHISTEHNMWHYLFFIVLVKVKDPTEFTGPESYVHQMVKVCISIAQLDEVAKTQKTEFPPKMSKKSTEK